MQDTARYATITALNVFPVKSCAGIPLNRARLTERGFEFDRQWMIVRPNGRFVTQRELPRLALIRPSLQPQLLQLEAPEVTPLGLDLMHGGVERKVVVWRDTCDAIDAGDAAAAWLEAVLGESLRLVRFDPACERESDRTWTRELRVLNQFSDGFPYLLISRASLAALNARLEHPLPMNRFRPNIVVDGIEAFEEDRLASLTSQDVELRPVKPCTRCAITTTNQATGEREGDEPLRTLRTFRFDTALRGVAFGQNVILARGAGEWLAVGQQFAVRPKE